MKHEEPDQIPFNLAGTTWTGIINGAYQKLLGQVSFDSEKPDWADLIQHIVTILYTNELKNINNGDIVFIKMET